MRPSRPRRLRRTASAVLAMLFPASALLVGGALTQQAAAVDAAPGELAIDVTTPDGSPVSGDLNIYRYDESDEYFYPYDYTYLDDASGEASIVYEVPDGTYYADFYDNTDTFLFGYSNGATQPPQTPSDQGSVDVTPTLGGDADIELVPIPDPVQITGTVVDAETSAPLEGAYAGFYSDYRSDDDFTGSDGRFSMTAIPGTNTYQIGRGAYVDVEGSIDVPEQGGDLGTFELQPEEPVIAVYVNDDTFGGTVEGATVTITPEAGPAESASTDAEGFVQFEDVAPGEIDIDASHPDYEDAATQTLDYEGGYEEVYVDLAFTFSCEPTTTHTGLTNMGFESGLTGWTVAHETESVATTGTDAFTSPWEGSSMAILGESQADDEANQPKGPNILCQDFVVDQATESFAFNTFTYDYTGFDEFEFDMAVVDPDTGETLAAYRQGAWGSGTALKTSGWRGVTLDLAGHVGDTVQLAFRSGGTEDDLYAFWTYLDSADQGLPPTVETLVNNVQTTSGSVTTDPNTGQLTVAYPAGQPSDLTLQLKPQCQDEGAVPTAVGVSLDGTLFEATETGTPGTFSVTIPADAMQNGTLSLVVDCDSGASTSVVIGEIVLYDPSGYLTDSKTDAPIAGAEVRLYKVPGWVPQDETGPHPANSCESNLSKAPGADWSQPAPTDLGVLVNAASPEIDPHVNPFISNIDGYYGWDVAEGCWYVTVDAEGYEPLVSPVVGVPPEVTDLDLVLTPLPTQECLDAQAALAEAQETLEEAESALTEAQAAQTAANNALAAAIAAADQADAAAAAAQVASEEAQAAHEQASADVAESESELATAQTRLKQVEAAAAKATAAAAKKSGQAKAAKAKAKKAKSKAKALKKKGQKAKAKKAAKKAAKLKKRAKSLAKNGKALRSAASAAQAKVSAAQAAVKAAQASLAQKRSAEESAAAEATEAAAEEQAATQAAEAAAAQRASAQSAANSAAAAVSAATSARNAAADAVAAAESEVMAEC